MIQESKLVKANHRPVLLAVMFGVYTLGSIFPCFATIFTNPDQIVDQRLPVDSQERQEQLDYMFARLKSAEDEQTARFIEMAIWQVWLKPDNQVIASMMEEILAARRINNYEKAVSLLDTLIERYPDYSEGWNQRATIYYMIGNFQASLRGVRETLAREPRHFGALAGRAAMQWQIGDKELARQSLRQAVEIYPFLKNRGMLSQ